MVHQRKERVIVEQANVICLVLLEDVAQINIQKTFQQATEHSIESFATLY